MLVNSVQEAERFATKAHEGQMREGGQQPYIEHPRRVALAMRRKWTCPDHVVCAAWMHDVLEDTKLTYTDMHSAGFDCQVVDLVMRLTRRPNETYAAYIVRIRDSHDAWAMRLKLADLVDNMSDLKDGSRRAKYELAHLILSEALDV